MEVKVAEKCGFCPGVRNAIKLAEKTLEKKEAVYCLGHIIHNEDVVCRLCGMGLKTVKSVDEIDGGTVLIRSHGATGRELEEIRQKGLKIVDATCVLVKRLQEIARQLGDEGYRVIIVGDKDHPEVKAVVGSASRVQVISGPEEVNQVDNRGKLGVICQTTQSHDHFAATLSAMVRQGFSEIRAVNTLCRETLSRQQAAVKLCREVDIMFVLGGLHSANTKKLAELCKKYNNSTFHLQNWAELDQSVLSGKRTAGVTAGASTPDWVIEEFVSHLRNFNPPA